MVEGEVMTEDEADPDDKGNLVTEFVFEPDVHAVVVNDGVIEFMPDWENFDVSDCIGDPVSVRCGDTVVVNTAEPETDTLKVFTAVSVPAASVHVDATLLLSIDVVVTCDDTEGCTAVGVIEGRLEKENVAETVAVAVKVELKLLDSQEVADEIVDAVKEFVAVVIPLCEAIPVKDEVEEYDINKDVDTAGVTVEKIEAVEDDVDETVAGVEKVDILEGVDVALAIDEVV